MGLEDEALEDIELISVVLSLRGVLLAEFRPNLYQYTTKTSVSDVAIALRISTVRRVHRTDAAAHTV
jgi:hypothetical protein